MAKAADDSTRLDRWLWAARAFRTRSLATQACGGGKVSVNDAGAKPHKTVRAGDVVSFQAGSFEKRWRIVAIAERRGPASVAQALYDDLTPPPPPRQAATDRAEAAEPHARRPSKRERRQLQRMKRG